MKLSTLSHSIIAGAFTMVTAAAAQSATVWDQRYEEFIDVDLNQTVICATDRHGSSELVYNDNYEEYVPRNFQRHVIRNDELATGSTRLVYKPEYEEYVPQALAGVAFGSEQGCPIS